MSPQVGQHEVRLPKNEIGLKARTAGLALLPEPVMEARDSTGKALPAESVLWQDRQVLLASGSWRAHSLPLKMPSAFSLACITSAPCPIYTRLELHLIYPSCVVLGR